VSDSGAVERNHEFAQRALERARLRNGGNGVVQPDPRDDVAATDFPVRSVDKPVRTTGGNHEEV
jgi:hypothetical protein